MVRGCRYGFQLRGCCTRLGEITGGLDQCGSSWKGEQWTDSIRILGVKWKELIERLASPVSRVRKEEESFMPSRFWRWPTRRRLKLTEDLRTIEGFWGKVSLGLKFETQGEKSGSHLAIWVFYSEKKLELEILIWEASVRKMKFKPWSGWEELTLRASII